MFFDLQAYASQIALYMENEEWSYGKLYLVSEKIAKSVGKRCLVFLLCSNISEAIAAYVGFLNHKIVPVMIDANLDIEMIRQLINKYKPSYIYCPTILKEDFANSYPVLVGKYYSLLDMNEEKTYRLNDDLALLMSTSGSTGSPKLVRQSYNNLQSNTMSIIKYLNINTTERAITNLPLYYVYGLSILNTHLKTGASLVVVSYNMFQREFWKLFKEKKVTNFGGVPYTFEMLKKLRFFGMDLPDLRYITQAGGKLDPELHQNFAEYAEKNNKKFIVMYGAAEATARMGYLPMERSLDKVGCMGIAIPGGKFELIDDVGEVISSVNVIGELVYYGDNVTMGYAESGQDLIKGDERNGRYETGDMAKRDQDGYYTVVGRKKRFLKLFGNRINLQEVEHIVRQHFGEVDVACSGKDDYLYIFVTNKSIIDKIIPYISKKIGIHHSAFVSKYIDEIPKNASGKTIYAKLEKYYDI